MTATPPAETSNRTAIEPGSVRGLRVDGEIRASEFLKIGMAIEGPRFPGHGRSGCSAGAADAALCFSNMAMPWSMVSTAVSSPIVELIMR